MALLTPYRNAVVTCLLALFVLAGISNAASAQSSDRPEVPRGLWQTEAGSDGIVYHVRTRQCGRALCGRVERVKDRRGVDTPSQAVSLMVLQKLKPQPDGSFLGPVLASDGQIYRTSRVFVARNALQMRLCDEGSCEAQVWERLR